MGLRRARSLSQLKKIPWVTYLKTSSPWDNIHVLTRQNWQNVDQSSWITIKKFYYKVQYEIFYESATAYFITKCNGLSNWLQTATTFFFITKYDRVYYIATRITKRDDYTACNSTRVPAPSLPSLEFKGMPWLQAKTEVLLIQVCMRIFSLNYLSELRNYSLVLQPQPTSKDKKGRSPMNALKLISIMKSMQHLSPPRWYRSLTEIRRWEKLFNTREQLSWRALNAVLLPVKFPLCIIFKHFYLSCLGDYFSSENPPQFIGR